MSGQLLVVDGNNLAHRMFHSMPPSLVSTSGVPVGAVHGFAAALARLVVDRSPAALLVVFDAGRDVRRSALDPGYKAHRAGEPDGLGVQLRLIADAVPLLGAAAVSVDGVEADDVIASAAERFAGPVEVLSADRDLWQLVSDRVTVLRPVKGVSELAGFDPATVVAKVGVVPGRYVDVAALRGDPSDGLAGVPGVGAVTAAGLIARFGSIDELYRRLDEVPGPARRAALVGHRDRVRLHVELMTLRRDVVLPVDVAALPAPTVDVAGFRSFVAVHGLGRLADRVAAIAASASAPF